MKYLLLSLFLALFAALGTAQQQSALVVRIKDGDTFVLRLEEGQMIDVRLSGIDCPEEDQPFGAVCTNFVAYLLNQKVSFKGVTFDRYGRLVADIYHNNQWLNKRLVEEGYAWHFREYSTDNELACAEYEARIAEKGLWKSGDAIYPKCWRSGERCSRQSNCGTMTLGEASGEVANVMKVAQSGGGDYFVCNSSGSVAYHINGQCKGLAKCTHEVVKMSAQNAEAKGKHSCRMCTASKH